MLNLTFLFSPTTVLFLPVLYTIYLVVVFYILDPLRSVPGPFLARFTRWWYFYAVWKGDFERTNVELHKKLGSVVRIAPGEYSIDDVEGARVIYGLAKGFVKVYLPS